MNNYTYKPSVFACATLEDAKKIILVPEGGRTTDVRWEQETEWLRQFLQFNTDLPILDYGCGVGRLAKLLKRPVLGVDISPTMRAHADFYVDRGDFLAIAPGGLEILVRAGLRCGGAVCSWVLQHAISPELDIGFIHDALVPGAHFWLLNRHNRAVPAQNGSGKEEWIEDGVDIFALLGKFTLLREVIPPPEVIVPGATLRCYLRRG